MEQREQDELEQFISQNREAFDVHEPDPALWQKVLGEEEKPKESAPLTTWLWRAAAVLVIMAAGTVLVQSLGDQGTPLAGTDSTRTVPVEPAEQELIIPELAEAEAYYANQLASMQGELNSYATTYPDLSEEATYDLAELDTAYAELKRDLKEDIANQEILNALIQNYRIKLRVLEDILEQIKKLENNQNEHENTDLNFS